jgi:asparagine synthetase B (glutamine-hydrolysing)
LYYHFDNGQLIFSSEIKGIITYLSKKFDFNTNKIREYLIKGQVIVGESDQTMFEGIKQLMPANNILFKENRLKFEGKIFLHEVLKEELLNFLSVLFYHLR